MNIPEPYLSIISGLLSSIIAIVLIWGNRLFKLNSEEDKLK